MCSVDGNRVPKVVIVHDQWSRSGVYRNVSIYSEFKTNMHMGYGECGEVVTV